MKLPLATILKFLFFCLFSTSLFSQVTLLTEDFNECSLPNNWSVNVVGTGTPVYNIGFPTNPNSDETTIDGSCMLIIDDDLVGNNTPAYAIQFFSNVFNGTTFPVIQLDIDLNFRPEDGTTMSIKVFDGTTLHEVKSWGDDNGTGNQFSDFEHYTLDLSYFASSTMQLVIEYDDHGGDGWWGGVDNIAIVGLGEGENVVLETFNDCGMPNGWTTQAQTGNDVWQFGLINNGNSSETSMNGTCFAYFDDDGIGENAPFSSALLTSAPFSGSDYANYTLAFDLILRKANDLEQVSVWVWNGTEAILAKTFQEDIGGPQFDEYERVEVDLSPFRNQTMQVVFAYSDAQDWGWWVGIDNVKVTGNGEINDLCSTAFNLTTGTECLSGSNLNAIFDGEQPACSNNNEAGLWYRYTTDFTGILKIETKSNFNDIITVFSGSCGSSTEVSCTNRDEFGFTGEQVYMDVVAGTDYLIRVSGLDEEFGLARGELCISAEEISAYPTPPLNDDCVNAIALQMDNPCVLGTNLNATFSGPEPSLNLKSRADIWYTFIPTTDQEIEVLTAADFADVITIYSGTCGAFSEVASNELGQSLKTAGLTPGEIYYIQIAGFFATLEGNICLSVETVNPTIAVNDLCSNATEIVIGGGCVAGENIAADFDGPNPSCAIFSDANVWYQFVAPASGGVKINTGADFVHSLAIYSGDCNDLSETNCFNNPIRCDGYFDVGGLTPGETYFIQIASVMNPLFGFLEGDFCIDLLDMNSTSDFEPLSVAVNVNCISEGFGQLIIETTGGVGAYTFQGDTAQDTFETGDEYIVVVNDENGCEISKIGTVECGEVPCFLNTDISKLDISCFGENNGQIFVNVLDGQAPYTYQWSNGATNALINGLGPGTYTVAISEQGECISNLSFDIIEPEILLSNISAIGESDSDMNDGSAMVEPTGGTEPYTFAWSNGANTQSIENVVPGIYTVTLTDDRGCDIVESIVVSDFDCALSIESVIGAINCHNGNDGFVEIYPEGGTAPFSYDWNTGADTDVVTNLGPGTYTVTIFDAAGCPWVENYTFTEPSELSVSASEVIGAECFGTATASATVIGLGGVAPYTYAWSNGGTGDTQSGIFAGNYIVTITDANACTDVNIIEVTQPEEIEPVAINTDNVSCFGFNDGRGTVIVNGGTPPYSFLWDDPNTQVTSQASDLGPGIYNVEVTDFNGCMGTTSVTITEPSEIVITIDAVFDETNNQGNGGAQVTVVGGTPPYDFDWRVDGIKESDDEDPNDLEAATYVLEITDENGCNVFSEEVVIDNLVGVNDPELEGLIDLLPNPTNGKFQLKMALENSEEVRVLITDVAGKILIETPSESVLNKTYDFDLSEYAAGVYPLKVFVGGKVFLKQVVVQK